jgi:hypothetical protein
MSNIHPLYWLWQEKLPILALLMTITTAAVATAPIPGQPFELYTWAYDWAHQVLNIKNTRLLDKPVPTPPESTEAQKTIPKI